MCPTFLQNSTEYASCLWKNTLYSLTPSLLLTLPFLALYPCLVLRILPFPILPLFSGLQWGLFTKWRRSGSAGHFCTRVHAGCMAGCVRPRKTHLGRATFCSFCLKTLRVILTDDLCLRKTWEIKRQKESGEDASIFFGPTTVSSVGLRTTCNTAERLLRWLAGTVVVGGKRRLRLSLFLPLFSSQKKRFDT